MNILIISPTQKGIGGVARLVQGLSEFLKQNGHHVDIISSENTFTIPIPKLKNPSFMISSYIKTKFSKKYDFDFTKEFYQRYEPLFEDFIRSKFKNLLENSLLDWEISR